MQVQLHDLNGLSLNAARIACCEGIKLQKRRRFLATILPPGVSLGPLERT
jgi:hypothetical protein